MPQGTRTLSWLPLVLLLLAAGGCASNPVTGESDFVLLSAQQERQLGRQEHPKILDQYGRYDDAQLRVYVERIGQRLAANSHRADLEYEFTVLDSDEVNAFALPGGYIYVTRGLLAYLNSEAELAAVLGHEIGHVTARHSVQQYSAQMAGSLGYTLGALFVPELRQQSAQDVFNVLSTALLRGYGREHELEADRLGAQYLARSGYAPEAMLDVIGVLKDQEQLAAQLAREQGREPQAYHGLFATHPANDQRLQTVVREAKGLQGPARPEGTEREPFVRRLAGLDFGPSASEGVVRGHAFYHAELDLALAFPADWSVDNRSDSLLAEAPGQAALLQVVVGARQGAATPQDYLLERFGAARLREGGRVRLPRGFEGYAALADTDTPYGRRPVRLAVVFDGDTAYIVAGVARDGGAMARYDRAFLDTIRSFRRLDAAEQRLARPLQIRLLRAQAETSFGALAQRSNWNHHAEEQLRLLNGYYPRGEPASGTLLKTLE